MRPLRLFLLFCAAAGIYAAPQPPALRLGDQVKPVHYAVHLTLDPAKDNFSGVVDIAIDIQNATPLFWLNARGLTIESASLTAGGKPWNATVEPGGEQFIGLSWTPALPAGAATLHLAFHGKTNKETRDGLFVVSQGGANYLVTQFEPLSARRVFPCFDEPGFKVPWQVTLDVPAAQAAFSNTSPVSETPDGHGGKTVRFAETKPLPSYLVAFAVGPFEVVYVGKFGRKKTPLRIIVPRGRKDEARSAAQVIPELFTRLEDYFDIPYAYDKLDSVAVPFFGGAAMENAGMITYSDTTLLRKPERQTDIWQQSLASDAAHEMAHQWFGDLVTMEWWNDTWLNEAFATWMSDHIVQAWKPEWKWELHRFRETAAAAATDGLASARRITQPAESEDDIANAFDEITYLKGGAVLAMFESSVGTARFRDGVQSYLRAHAYGSGRTEDFLAALSAATSPETGSAFRTFLDQPGIPEVSAALRCAGGAKPSVELRQQRSQPLGAKLNPETWRIPVCVKYSVRGRVFQQCTPLEAPAQEVVLSDASACPDWLLPNAGATGYYWVNYPGDSLRQLLERAGSHLSVVEQVSILAGAQALVATGEIPAANALAAVPLSAQSTEGDVVRAAMAIATSLERVLPDNLLPNYSRFIAQTFSKRAHLLGWKSQPGDSLETRQLRANIVSIVATKGNDQGLASEATALALKWLADRKAVEPDMVPGVLATAAYYGDRQLFDRFRAAALASKDPNEQELLLVAMGRFTKPELATAALEELTRSDFDLTASFRILPVVARMPETKRAGFDFITSHFDQLRPERNLGIEDFGADLALVGASFCTEQDLQREKAFFEARAQKFTGGPRELAQVLESIQSCIAEKQAQEASLAAFYGKY
jgi:cytosol alanyl aminopeptidase